jgi:hypothetical protein
LFYLENKKNNKSVYFRRNFEVFLLKTIVITENDTPPPSSPQVINSEGYKVAKNGQNHFFFSQLMLV